MAELVKEEAFELLISMVNQFLAVLKQLLKPSLGGPQTGDIK